MQKHQLIQQEGHWYCSVCHWSWKHFPRAQCPGVQRFAYAEAPSDYLTYTELRALRLKPLDAHSPGGCYWRVGRREWLWFYDRRKAVPVRAYRRKQEG